MASTSITKRGVGDLLKQAQSMKKRAESVVKNSEERVSTLVHTAEVAVGAYAAGVMQGRFSDPDPKKNKMLIAGMPADLAIGVGAHVLSFMGFAGKNAEHLTGFGDGFIAGHTTHMGQDVGMRMKKESDKIASETPKGELEDGRRGTGLTDKDLDELRRGAPAERAA